MPSAGGSILVQLLVPSDPLPPPRLAVQMLKVPLDPFRACIFIAHGATEWAYRSQVAAAGVYFRLPRRRHLESSHPSTDLITFVCIVVFVLKLKAGYGQSRMNRLMRTILQDGVLYFFIMVAFHIAMVFFVFFGRVIRTFSPVC